VDTLLRVGLSNAVAACGLAAVAAAVGYFCRRPAVRHALWLLVLLKFVTPPLIDVPVWHAAPAEDPAAVAEAPAPPEIAVVVRPAEEEGPAPFAAEEPAAPQEEPAVALDDAEPASPPPGEPRAEPATAPALAWRPLVAAAWLAGSALWLAVAGLRARRFASLLRYAKPAPAWLQREAGDVAVRLGLKAAPALWLVPGRVSPMLWAPGWTARLLLPAGLLDRLDGAGRRTLLAHELAHLRRGDHRVRLFELLVTSLFWWHPIVWLARRELREAEEQCCDAWVLFALPESAKPYALALVETVDFLSEAPPALPALASGVGHVHDLRRRVTMIMQGTTPRALTWGGVLGLLGLGTFLLPVAPSWAQEGQPSRSITVVADGDAKAEDVKKAVGEAQDLQRLLAELEKKRAELAQLEAKVKAAKEHMTKGAGGAKATEERRVIVLEVVDGDKREVIKLPAGSRVIGGDPAKNPPPKGGADALEAARVKLQIAAEELKKKELGAKEKEKGKDQRIIIEIISDGKRQVIELPPGSRVIGGDQPKGGEFRWSFPGTASPPVKVVPPGSRVEIKPGQGAVRPPAGDTEKRIADLEKRLEELMRSVKELHGELNRPKPPAPPQPPKIPNRQFFPKVPEANNPLVPTPPTPPTPPKPPQEGR
jgi:bla regulator protein BlaR1